MSVLGVDLGNQFSEIATIKAGGVEVLMNSISKRETATMVGFGSGERRLGVNAASSLVMNYKNTVRSLMSLIGRDYASSEVQALKDSVHVQFKIVEGEAGKVGISVPVGGETRVLSVESVLSMVLGDLVDIAKEALASNVKDVAVTCPSFFTDGERRAMLDALQIAGLNCLKLINTTTAVALDYGFYKTEIEDDAPRTVMFVDLGESSLEVSVVKFTKDKLQVLGRAYDRTLGGRNFDEALFEHMAETFKSQNKIDVKSSAKATIRLMAQVEKLKKVFTTNPEGRLAIECLMDDKDVSCKMSREDFEALVIPLGERVAATVAAALESAGVEASALTACEMVGGGSRIRIVRNSVQGVLGGMDLSDTVNKTEAAARGSALQGAMLSPLIRVRDYKVVDAVAHPISITWVDDSGESKASQTFAVGNNMPSSKLLTFYRGGDFDVQASYDEAPTDGTTAIGAYHVSGFPSDSDSVFKVKLKVKMDKSGILRVPWAYYVVETEEEEEAPAADEAAGDAAGEADKAATDKAGDDAAAAAEGEEPKKKKKKTKRVDLRIESKPVGGMSADQLMVARELEVELALQDRVIRETADAKNALESAVYDYRSSIREGQPLAEFMENGVREALISTLNDLEDWLYDEGDEETKSVYQAKLKELDDALAGPRLRQAEESARPGAIATFMAACAQHEAFVNSTDDKYAHITEADRAPLATAVQEARAWFEGKLEEQAAKSKLDDPAFTAADLKAKARSLSKTAKPIMNKPKPKPKVEEAPAPAAGDDAAASGADAGAETGAETGADDKAGGASHVDPPPPGDLD